MSRRREKDLGQHPAPSIPIDALAMHKAFYSGVWEGLSRRMDMTTGALIDNTRVRTTVGFTDDGRFSRELIRYFPDGRMERSYNSGTVKLKGNTLEVDVGDYWWITTIQSERTVATQVLHKDNNKRILMHSMCSLETTGGQVAKTVVRHLNVGSKVTLEFLQEELKDPTDVFIPRDPEEVEREMRLRRDLGLAEGENLSQVTDPNSGSLVFSDPRHHHHYRHNLLSPPKCKSERQSVL